MCTVGHAMKFILSVSINPTLYETLFVPSSPLFLSFSARIIEFPPFKNRSVFRDAQKPCKSYHKTLPLESPMGEALGMSLSKWIFN
jgi:hypothetical protein